MERSIFKYELKITDEQAIKMPSQSEILTAQVQDGKIQLWAIVYPSNPKELIAIEIYGTGSPFPSMGMAERKYISTVQLNGLVWHIFQPI